MFSRQFFVDNYEFDIIQKVMVVMDSAAVLWSIPSKMTSFSSSSVAYHRSPPPRSPAPLLLQ